MERAEERAIKLGRPLVTLSYAQSLDGCLTAQSGMGLAISGEQTKLLTHQLRAANDAILVGIGTVLADDPRLTARLAGGAHPLPLVLDSQLRMPLAAALLRREDCKPWVFCGADADRERRANLERAGARVITLPQGADGRLDLSALLAELYQAGLHSLMVEGGARVLSAFLLSALGDQAMITIGNFWAGGNARIEFAQNGRRIFPSITAAQVGVFGGDWVVWGTIGEEIRETSGPVFHSTAPG